MPDLITGTVKTSMTGLTTVMPYVRTGQLRAIGVTTKERSAGLPDVPTIAEAGVPGYESVNWLGMFAPAGAPPQIVKKLNLAIVDITNTDPAIKTRMAPDGFYFMISGHTTLSTAVWGVAFALLCRAMGGNARLGACVGLLAGLITAVARVFDHAHAIPEVVAGWFLGAAVAALFVGAFARSEIKMYRPSIAAVGLLFVTSVAYGHHAPIQALIEHYSPGLCARALSNL